jgi:undecaprenyl-diphosphatase
MCPKFYDQLVQLDRKLFLAVNQFQHPWADNVVYWVTHEAFWIPLYAFLLYLIISNLQRRAWLALLGIGVLIALCDQFASGLIKPWVGRLRPCFNPHLQEIVHVVGRHHGLHGFISSHAANTFGIATYLYLLLGNKYSSLGLLFVWALGVSYARIYGGVHYPGDVLVGAMTGIGWGWCVYKLYTFMSKKWDTFLVDRAAKFISGA